jgi:hypothetical protein
MEFSVRELFLTEDDQHAYCGFGQLTGTPMTHSKYLRTLYKLRVSQSIVLGVFENDTERLLGILTLSPAHSFGDAASICNLRGLAVRRGYPFEAIASELLQTASESGRAIGCSSLLFTADTTIPANIMQTVLIANEFTTSCFPFATKGL